MSKLKAILKDKANKAKPASPTGIPGAARPKDVKKRWLYVFVGFMGLAIAGSAIFGSKPDPRPQRQKDSNVGTVSVTPPNADKAAFEARYGKDLETMRAQLEDLRRQNEQQAEKLAKLEEERKKAPAAPAVQTPPGIVPPPVGPGQNTGGIQAIPAPPVPPVPPVRTPKVPAVTDAPPLPALPAAEPAKPLVFSPPKSAANGAQGGATPGTPGQGPRAQVNYRKNENAGLLPAGAFAEVALLNGLDAGTSSTTQSNPMPVLMNITDNATLPGAAKYRLKNCFVLGSGYGDLSAERVYIRFSRLSCIDKNDRLVLSQEVQGYVVDSDGKVGMRGMVADRQGAKLGKAMLASFAQGLAGALSQAQSTVESNIIGGTTTSISGSAALRASGLAGAQGAAQQLAEFYLSQAQSIFPVITVDAGRLATIVFTNSTPLNWSSTDDAFVPQVTPQSK